MSRIALALLGGAALVAICRARRGARLGPRDHCPACGAAITLAKCRPGRRAFTCWHCGEVATWI